MDRVDWQAAVHVLTESGTTERLTLPLPSREKKKTQKRVT